VPYPLTWAHEQIDETALKRHERYRRIDSLAHVSDALASLPLPR
jgi:hypothetical protein